MGLVASKQGRPLVPRWPSCLFVLLLLHATPSWSQVEVVVEGRFGSAPGEFGLASDGNAVYDLFPQSIAVDIHGDLVVADERNSRIQVFDPAGTLASVVVPVDLAQLPAFTGSWPASWGLLTNELLVSKTGDVLSVYRYSGELESRLANVPGFLHVSGDGLSLSLAS